MRAYQEQHAGILFDRSAASQEGDKHDDEAGRNADVGCVQEREGGEKRCVTAFTNVENDTEGQNGAAGDLLGRRHNNNHK